MTSPDGAVPAGSLAPGLFAAAQARTAEDAKAEMTAEPISSYISAQDIWKMACQRQRKTVADLQDGQNALRNRLDLLDEVSGYGTAVMAYNWDIPYSTWCVLPFETQLGPMKGVSVSTPAAETGFLTLKRGGLWRVDAQIAITGMSIGVSWMWTGGAPGQGVLLPYNTYAPIFPKVMLEVVDANGALISAQQFDMVADLALHTQGIGYANAPRSGAFSKTFVVDEMPDEDDPDAPAHWVHVRLAIRYSPVYTGTLNATSCKVLGGTKYSALSATRWSRDASHINYADEVPDGGELG
ncbi:MAG: hypothetical protein ACI38R_11040 [Rhodococcus sp. (in: high G+C Gram-positive bacteria)]